MSLPGVLKPLRARPQTAAVFLDFDGTLAEIVEDPELARPLPGVPELLAELGARFGVVAVVSGRPAAFLEEHLGRTHGVRLIGLYGLEEVGHAAGPTVDSAALEQWRPLMAALADEAERSAPPGVSVERKVVGFTLHFRRAAEHEGWVQHFAAVKESSDGLVAQPGRMAVELRPGIAADKGTVVAALAQDCSAACCFGDDLGDLAAFDALAELASRGIPVARVAVADAESPRAVADAADLVVEGPSGAMQLLRALAESAD
ncbi:MAG: trehalose-phosphatase [Acidimicrobiales bacterium]